MKLITVPEMVAIEKAADASGHSFDAMMACAGKGLAEIIRSEYGGDGSRSVLVFAGKGNNGGDALVAIKHLGDWGWQCAVLLVGREKDALVEGVERAGWPVYTWPETGGADLGNWLAGFTIVLDGVLGTGIHLPLRPPVGDFLAKVKMAWPVETTLVAVDTPSGLDCQTGAIADETLDADITVTMAAAKIGFFSFPAHEKIGILRVADIGLPAGLPEWEEVRRIVVDDAAAGAWLPRRPHAAHKGTFGTAWIVAGSRNYVGAALLAGRGSFRAGAGLILIACPQSVYEIAAGHFPESTWLPLPENNGAIAGEGASLLLEKVDRADAMLLGPGLGQSEGTLAFVENLLDRQADLPHLVVDADGLNLLSKLDNWPKRLPENTVLTPHPGEMGVLTGYAPDVIQADRIGIAEKFAASWGHIVVLKGAFTVIAAPDGRTALIPISTPALARAGTGDVLGGMITGLLAQGAGAFEAASLGAYLHGWAGLLAERQVQDAASVLASDVIDAVGASIGRLRGFSR